MFITLGRVRCQLVFQHPFVSRLYEFITKNSMLLLLQKHRSLKKKKIQFHRKSVGPFRGVGVSKSIVSDTKSFVLWLTNRKGKLVPAKRGGDWKGM